jgi:lipopolysaccharide export system protein LptC
MAWGNISYSRVILFLKILLPLISIIMLSSIFLLSRSKQTAVEIPFASQDLEQRIKDQRVSNPFYTGTNVNGDDIRVWATLLRHDSTQDDVLHLNDVEMSHTSVAQKTINITSETGSFYKKQDKIHLKGSVLVKNSDGYDATTPEAWVFEGGLRVEADGPVVGTGPASKITAGHMVMTKSEKGGPMQIYFTQGVNLVYDPKKRD